MNTTPMGELHRDIKLSLLAILAGVLVGGNMRPIQAGEVPEVKEQPQRNARQPHDDQELEYWLQNMIWHHRFTSEEARGALGLTQSEIAAAQERFNIHLHNGVKPQ